MKISVLLPYKENFSSVNAGAVSLFVKDTIKNSKFSIIEEAGHLVNIENPKAFNYTVLQFLKKI